MEEAARVNIYHLDAAFTIPTLRNYGHLSSVSGEKWPNLANLAIFGGDGSDLVVLLKPQKLIQERDVLGMKPYWVTKLFECNGSRQNPHSWKKSVKVMEKS